MTDRAGPDSLTTIWHQGRVDALLGRSQPDQAPGGLWARSSPIAKHDSRASDHMESVGGRAPGFDTLFVIGRHHLA